MSVSTQKLPFLNTTHVTLACYKSGIRWVILLTSFLIAQASYGQLQAIPCSNLVVSSNFNALGSSASANLPTPWRYYTSATPTWSGTNTPVAFAAGTSGTGALTGSSSTGLYNLASGVTASATDRSVGTVGVGTSSFVGGFANSTGSVASSACIVFDLKKFHSGTDPSNWTVFWGTAANSQTNALTAADYSFAADANSTTLFDPAPAVQRLAYFTPNIAVGGFIYIKIVCTGATSAATSQVVGLDNFEIAFSPIAPGVTSPATATATTNEPFTYTPTSATSGATFTWSRAAVTGISNAAVTSATPVSTSFTETLINTTTSSVDVVYYVTARNPATGVKSARLVTVTVLPAFTAASTGYGINYGDVAWGDFDNDGDLDPVAVGEDASATGNFRLLRNSGAVGTWAPVTVTGSVGVSNGTVNWVDYDKDGDLDLHYTGYSGILYYNRLLENNGSGSFSTKTNFTGVTYGAVAWGDYDNDGDQDCLYSGLTASATRITELRRNDGGGNFTLVTVSITGANQASLDWGDYDNDGDLDVLQTGLNPSFNQITRIWRNDGGATFTSLSQSIVNIYRGGAEWGDYDGDGDLDILISGAGASEGTVQIHKNNGNSTFTNINIAFPAAEFGEATWGDFDNDGDLDVALSGTNRANNSRRFEIWKNNGGDAFSLFFTVPSLGISNADLAWGDFDADGDLDLAFSGVTNTIAAYLGILTNNTTIGNAAATAPTSLTSTQTSCTTTTLNWARATDTETL